MKKLLLACTLLITSTTHPLSYHGLSRTINSGSSLVCKDILPSLLIAYGYEPLKKDNQYNKAYCYCVAACVSIASIATQATLTTCFKKHCLLKTINTGLVIAAPFITTHFVSYLNTEEYPQSESLFKNFFKLMAQSFKRISEAL